MFSRLLGPWPCSPEMPPQPVPLMGVRVPAGFPSPAEDWAEERVDFNQRFIRHPEATFFFTVDGDSMQGPDPARSIAHGALLVVDRALEARHGDVVVAVLDGDFTVKRLFMRNGHLALVPENPAYPSLVLQEGQSLEVWGVVIGCYQAFRQDVRPRRRQ
ncbi:MULTISPECIES: LexA family transcriptional regulator [Chitinibacter]|uniref:LexA family protein n=1 Tax=Chitinibacter TaxID=230666 RepID=UPI0006484E71|nr:MULTISPECIES: translesion error-prone DNA polymerase V autoproteolytic subunit [Chitinibacter]